MRNLIYILLFIGFYSFAQVPPGTRPVIQGEIWREQATPPASPQDNEVYLDTDGFFYKYNGTSWEVTDENDYVTSAVLAGSTLTLTIPNQSNVQVSLASLLDNTDNQTVTDFSLEGTVLSITLEDGNTVTLDIASIQDGTGTDDQTIAEVLASGNDAGGADIDNVGNLEATSISSSGAISLIPNGINPVNVNSSQIKGVDDPTDATDAVNLQYFQANDSDDQAISQSGNTITLEDGGSVDISTTTAVAANTAKTTNATHTGEVTGSGALTIASGVVDSDNIVDGTIDETDLDTSVNASLDLADSAIQTEVDGSTTNEIQNLSEVLTEGNDAGAVKIVNLADPTLDQDAATKAYVDLNNSSTEIAITTTSGWADYADSQYTSGSPLSLTADTDTQLPNNRGTIRDDEKPSDITDFVNSSGLITGVDGDSYLLTMEFKVTPTSVNTTYLEAWVDIGGAVGELYRRSFSFPKGNGVERVVTFSTGVYTLDTWETNSATPYIRANGTADVYDIRFVVYRLHKAGNQFVNSNSMTSDDYSAIIGAASPSASNVFATVDDLPSVADLSYESVTYASSVNRTYDPLRPNFEIDLTGNIVLNVTGASSGSGYVNINRSGTGYEKIDLSAGTPGNDFYFLVAPNSVVKLRYVFTPEGLTWFYEGEKASIDIDNYNALTTQQQDNIDFIVFTQQDGGTLAIDGQ